MDLEKISNVSNLAQANYLFEPRFINLEYLFYQFYLLLRKFGLFGGSSSKDGSIKNGDSLSQSGDISQNGVDAGSPFFDSFVDFLSVLFYILLIFFVLMISYMIVRMYELRKREGLYLEEEMRKYNENQAKKVSKIEEIGSKNPRWIAVVDYMKSESENDWRLAILESDTILDSLLDSLGFIGDTTGEKLKKADPVKFENLNKVWEAHNIRNRIAHEGTEFKISKHEADRVIYTYEQVFRYYNYI